MAYLNKVDDIVVECFDTEQKKKKPQGLRLSKSKVKLQKAWNM